MRFISLDAVDSTNLEAKRLAEQGDFGPLWIRADAQSAGRGRRGRDWTSETGNLFCSGLYPHEGTVQQAAQLSFVAALAVADTLAHYVPNDFISLKWPNDVLLAGKKTAGILLESGQTHRHGWCIIGIGVNLTHHPEKTEFPATHLLDHIPADMLDRAEPIYTGPDAFLSSLSAMYSYYLTLFKEDGFEPIQRLWTARAHNIPGPVTVRLPNESFTGEALGLDANGALRVKLSNGTIRDVHAGDVFFGAS